MIDAKQNHNAITYVLLGLILLVACATRFYGIDRLGLWSDELWAITANHDYTFFEMLRFVYHHENHPPGYYILQRINVFFLGNSDFAVRFPSVVAGLMLVGAVFIAARKHFSNAAALIAATLVASTYYSIYYSQEARANIFIALFAVLVFHHFRAIVIERDNSKKNYLAFYISAACISYLHYSGLIFILCTGIFYLLCLAFERNREFFILGLKLYIPVVIAYLPWLMGTYHHIVNGPVEGWQKTPTFDTVISTFIILYGHGKLTLTVYFAGVICSSLILLRNVFTKQEKECSLNITLLLFLIFLPVIIFFVKSIISQPAYNDRHFVYIIPLTAILSGYIIYLAIYKLKANIVQPLLACVIIVLLIYQVFSNIHNNLYTFHHHKEEYREAVDVVAADLDFIYAPGSFLISNNVFFDHYMQRYNPNVKSHFSYKTPEEIEKLRDFLITSDANQFYFLELAATRGMNTDLLLKLMDNYQPVCRTYFRRTQVVKFKVIPATWSYEEYLPPC